jgi:hypothetical protein
MNLLTRQLGKRSLPVYLSGQTHVSTAARREHVERRQEMYGRRAGWSRSINEITCVYRTPVVSSRPWPSCSTEDSLATTTSAVALKKSPAPAWSSRLQPASESALPLAELLDEFGGDPNFMTSLARGILVIQAFSEQKRKLSISQLSQRTGLSRASVRRCLYTLSKLGFAGADDGRNFNLRPAWMLSIF